MPATLVRVGTETDGDPAMLAPLAAAWWTRFVQVVRLELGIELEIIQARGTYDGSGGTHADGYAIDIRTWRFTTRLVLAIVAIARRYGASATWYRTTVGSGPHIHLVVDMTGIAWTASHYQTVAVRAGYDGLGAGGRARKDPHPAPPRWINAREGIARMTTYLEENMPLSPDDLKRISDLIDARLQAHDWTKVIPDDAATKSTPAVLRSSWRNNIWQVHAKLDRIIRKIGA